MCIFVVSPQTFADAATIGSSVSQMLEDPKSEPESNSTKTNTATNSEPVSQNTASQVWLTVLHTLCVACAGGVFASVVLKCLCIKWNFYNNKTCPVISQPNC